MILSIDPGKKGGAVLWTNKGELADTYQFDIPSQPRIPADMHEFKQWVPPRVHTIVCEAPADYRTIGSVVHKNTQNMIYGYQLGSAAARCQPKNGVALIPAITWKKYFGLTKDKKAALRMARATFPDLATNALKLEKNDGVAEAILIGLYYTETNL